MTKISDNDLGYYMKLINCLKNDYKASPFLKGFFNSEEKAMDLLIKNNYDVQLCLKKILFPTSFITTKAHLFNKTDSAVLGYNMTHKQEVEETTEINHSNSDYIHYVNSAVHDLIGSNTQEKEEWLTIILKKLENGVDYSELHKLIEIGEKLKLDIPCQVINELEKSYEQSKKIKKILLEKNCFDNLEQLHNESKKLKIRTDEYYILNDAINKSKQWLDKATVALNSRSVFKSIQNIFNEGKNIPVKFSEFDKLREKYHKAQQWQDKLAVIPKHSKTRQGIISKTSERTTISELKKLIIECDEINFTSGEVQMLKTNFSTLINIENRILMTYEDYDAYSVNDAFKSFNIKRKIGKEALQEFINQLDNLRFNTCLFDDLILELDFIEWNEKKNAFITFQESKPLKIKQLKSLVQEALKKKLNSSEFYKNEIENLINQVDLIDNWISVVSNIFFKDSEIDFQDQFTIEEVNKLKLETDSFQIKTEEVDFLLEKIEEVTEFIEECSSALNNKTYNQDKLEQLKDKISNYNIKCPQFIQVSTHLNDISNWYNNYLDFFSYLDKKLKIIINFNLTNEVNSEIRQFIMLCISNFNQIQLNFNFETAEKMLFINPNKIKYETEMEALKKIVEKTKVFEKEKGTLLESNVLLTSKDLIDILIETKAICCSDDFFNKLILKIKQQSLLELINNISTSTINTQNAQDKLSLNEAEHLFKEMNALSINTSNEYLILKRKILITKDWLKYHKKILSSITSDTKITFSTLETLLSEGVATPLYTDELDELYNYCKALESMINTSRNICKDDKKIPFSELEAFIKKINNVPVEVPEFEILLNLFKLCFEWKEHVKIILSQRKFCCLYFENTEITKAEPSEKIKKEINSLFYHNFHMNESIIEENNITQENNYLSKKRHKSNSLTHSSFKESNEKREEIDEDSSSLEITQSPDVKHNKKKIKTKVNFNISNYSHNENENLYLAPALDNLKIKNFENLAFNERLFILSKKIILREDNNEKFCICRQGDDGVNFMIGCEYCKEWFHGACIKLPKSIAGKDIQYVCSFCKKRYDKININFSNDFFNSKRPSIEEFLFFIQEGMALPVEFEEIDIILDWNNKYENWYERFEKLMNEYTRKFIIPFNESSQIWFRLEEEIQKDFINLFTESEGYPMVISSAIFSVIVLKHYDWFTNSKKCFEIKKPMDKHIRKLFQSFERLFNWNTDNCKLSENEKNYLDKISEKANILNKKHENRILLINHVNVLSKKPSFVNHYRDFENIIDQYDYSKDITLEQLNNYVLFKNSIISSLEQLCQSAELYKDNSSDGVAIDLNNQVNDELVNSNVEVIQTDDFRHSLLIRRSIILEKRLDRDNKKYNINITHNNLALIYEISREFQFQTYFLDSLIKIISNFNVLQADFYLDVLDESRLNKKYKK